MPTFDTPEPISVTLTLIVGDARIIASERSDTVVEVHPSDRSDRTDVKAAEQTRVEYSNGALRVTTPQRWRHYSPFSGPGGSIDVVIALPAGSHLRGEAAMGDVHGEGQLGEVRFTTATGNLWLDRTGPLHLGTSAGAIAVDRVAGDAEVTGSGTLRIREIDGTAVIKNLNGDTWVGTISGDLRCHAANGDITVGRAHASVGARTAHGSVRVGEAARGSILLDTASGELEIGVGEGTAALLDLRSRFGTVHNDLDAADGPQPSDETVTIRARTSHGDIVIRRSRPHLSTPAP